MLKICESQPPPDLLDAAHSASLKAEVVNRAMELGFSSCRIVQSAVPRHKGEFREWLREGENGQMEWMERAAEKRCDPARLLPGVRSIIIVTMNYWQGQRPSDLRDAAGFGRIARYAWGDDYHEVMLGKLRELDAFLSRQGGEQKCYVDTGPVLERDQAAEAGIGWHGKSTMLVDQKLGTWFFLGEILTSLQLPPDPPQKPHCGACTRCMSACPTGAITEAHRLDARRCISYLTIELKGSIPLEFRPLIGDRIYGCDACLDACPWNRFAAVSRETAFALRPATAAMKLRDYLGLNGEQFRVLFRGSPIKRVKRSGLLRNVCVALGNVGTRDDLPALERAAAEPDPLIAEHARWAICRIRARLSRESSERPQTGGK